MTSHYIKEEKTNKEMYLLFQKWLTSKLNNSEKKKEYSKYPGYGSYLNKMVEYLINNNYIEQGGLRRVDVEYYDQMLELIENNEEVNKFDYECGRKAPHAALAYYPIFINQVGLYGFKKVEEAIENNMDISWLEGEEVVNNNPTDKEIIEQVNQYIQSKGFSYPSGMIENFYLSLKSKPFVILAGISGTGKTRLVKLFSEAIQAKYKVVPVRPDWSDSSDLFGHLDLNGTFVSGQVIDFIKEAIDHPNEPYILLLDEMNLARVEYYLSDFLSVIETRDIEDGKFVSSPLVSEAIFGDDEDARSKYGDMIYPENLYVVGTVNMDETTFPFSKKVLDRANTIEFSYVNLEPSFANFGASKTIKVENSFLSTKYLFLKDCISQKEKVTSICKELQEINNLLQKNNLHVGYRVRDEIVFYLLNNLETGLLSEEVALDNEIMQKILPRIQGSSTNLKKVLIELFIHCVPAFTKPTSEYDNIADDMFKSLDKAEYKNSATKIAFMVRRFEEDGFTSYWL